MRQRWQFLSSSFQAFVCTSLSAFPHVAWLDIIIISDPAGSDVALITAPSSLISIYLLVAYCATDCRTISRYRHTATNWRLHGARTDNIFPFLTSRDFVEHAERSILRSFELYTMKRHFSSFAVYRFFWNVYIEIVVAALEYGWINRWPVQYVARVSRSIYRVYAVCSIVVYADDNRVCS